MRCKDISFFRFHFQQKSRKFVLFFLFYLFSPLYLFCSAKKVKNTSPKVKMRNRYHSFSPIGYHIRSPPKAHNLSNEDLHNVDSIHAHEALTTFCTKPHIQAQQDVAALSRQRLVFLQCHLAVLRGALAVLQSSLALLIMCCKDNVFYFIGAFCDHKIEE